MMRHLHFQLKRCPRKNSLPLLDQIRQPMRWMNQPAIITLKYAQLTFLSGLFLVSGCQRVSKPVIPESGPTMAMIYQEASGEVASQVVSKAAQPTHSALPKTMAMAVLSHSVQVAGDTIRIPTYIIHFPL